MHFAIAITALLSAAAVQGANITVKVGANNGVSHCSSDHGTYFFGG